MSSGLIKTLYVGIHKLLQGEEESPAAGVLRLDSAVLKKRIKEYCNIWWHKLSCPDRLLTLKALECPGQVK